MKTAVWLSLLPLTATACAIDPIGSDEERVAVVDQYGREFRWDAPEACTVFLDRRITDQEARVVEYLARVDGAPASILYALHEGSELPVRVEVYAPGGAHLAIALDEERLVARGRDGEVALEVVGYAGGPDATEITVAAPIDEAALLALTACALPLRAELGPVPPFLRNQDVPGRLSDDPDVSQGSSDARPILPWSGRASILGALLLQAACTQPDGWACPCLAGSGLAEVDGWCAS